MSRNTWRHIFTSEPSGVEYLSYDMTFMLSVPVVIPLFLGVRVMLQAQFRKWPCWGARRKPKELLFISVLWNVPRFCCGAAKHRPRRSKNNLQKFLSYLEGV
ncbi:hypothetical protein AAY473_010702 [Plecturocebus cupreus]